MNDKTEIQEILDEWSVDVGLRTGWRAWVPSTRSLRRHASIIVVVAVGIALSFYGQNVVLIASVIVMLYFSLIKDDQQNATMNIAKQAHEQWHDCFMSMVQMKELLDRLKNKKHPLDGAHNVVIFDSSTRRHDA